MPIQLSEDEFAELTHQAIASLPEQFRKHMETVSINIRPTPTRQMLAKTRISSKDLLLGLYQGVPLIKKSVSAPYEFPQQITLFQKNIEAVCSTRSQIVRQIRLTVLHEIGHYFGMEEEDLRRLGYG